MNEQRQSGTLYANKIYTYGLTHTLTRKHTQVAWLASTQTATRYIVFSPFSFPFLCEHEIVWVRPVHSRPIPRNSWMPMKVNTQTSFKIQVPLSRHISFILSDDGGCCIYCICVCVCVAVVAVIDGIRVSFTSTVMPFTSGRVDVVDSNWAESV